MPFLQSYTSYGKATLRRNVNFLKSSWYSTSSSYHPFNGQGDSRKSGESSGSSRHRMFPFLVFSFIFGLIPAAVKSREDYSDSSSQECSPKDVKSHQNSTSVDKKYRERLVLDAQVRKETLDFLGTLLFETQIR